MPFNIIRNNITKVSADAIVNTANPEVAVGAGVDEAIYRAAGWQELFAEREKIGPMRPGEAAVTPAFALDAKYIIHTVGPAWIDGNCGEREAVASCYRESLRLASMHGCESIAFPLISTGTYRFPKDEALRIAVSEISSFLFSHDMQVILVVYDRESFVISGKAFSDIRSYIDEKDVRKPAESGNNYEYAVSDSIAYKANKRRRSRRRSEARREPALFSQLTEASCKTIDDDLFGDLHGPAEAEPAAAFQGDLEELLKQRGETFQQMLFRIIDRKGLKDPEVYKKANIDRKLFSKIRSNESYTPSKRTALALAVALELNLDETMDLLRKAGYALSPSSRFDLIVGYCIDHRIYNIFDINVYLFDYEQPLLGA